MYSCVLFFIHSDNLCLLIRAFSLFTFHMYGLKSTVLEFVLHLSHLNFIDFPALLTSFVCIDYFEYPLLFH